VNADALAEKVWGRHFVSPENVAQRVMLLRQSLGDDANKRRYIETVRNRGYRLVPIVETVLAQTPGIKQQPRRLVPAAVLLLAVGIIAAGGYWLAGTVEQASPLRSTVAVLPFENLSLDPSDAYFAVAMHAEVINQLVKVGSLNVIRAPSVAGYAGTSKPIAEIARELNVTAVLEGTVAYADRRIALNVTLTDTATGHHLWSERYDRALVDVFDIQADIASRIAVELAAELMPTRPAGPERRPTDSPEAYALYLEAVSLAGRENSSDRRIALLDRAIGFDDGFADAYALRASSYAARVVDNTTGDGVSVAARPDYERLARADAERVLQLDPTSVDALAALGMIDVVSWHWTSARAIRACDPGGDASLCGRFTASSGPGCRSDP
jgi:TolB-like protein